MKDYFLKIVSPLHSNLNIALVKRGFSLLITLCIYLFSAQAWGDEGIAIIPYSSLKAYQYTLNNGLQLIVIPDHRNTLATLNFILDAGSDREVKGSTGLAHFFEHMMFRKTKGEAEGNYDRILNSIGGSGNAGTNDSLVTYYSTFPAPALKIMLKLESQRFLSLDLTDPYFSTEKGAVISERKMRVENDPVQRGYEMIRKITERQTPQEWMVIGTKSDVQNLNIKTVQAFYNDFYRPNNTFVVVGGPFNPLEVKQLVETYFGKWTGQAPKNTPNYPADYLTRDIGKSFICGEPITTKNIQLTYPSYDTSVKSLVYSWLFSAMLDDNPQGPFEYRLQKLKLADKFSFDKTYGSTKSNPYTASFVLSNDQKIETVKQFWDAEVAKILNRPLSQTIIQQVLKQQKVYDANLAEHLSSIANTITENAFLLKDPAAQETEMKILQSVTTEDFSKWANQVFANKKYYTIGIVPSQDAPACSLL